MRSSPIAAIALLAFCVATYSFDALAHEVRPAYLGLTEVSDNVFNVVWKQPQQNGRRLRLNPILPPACAMTGIVENELVAGASVKTWKVRCDAHAFVRQAITIDGLTRSLTDVWVNFERLQHDQNLTTVLNAANPTVRLQNSSGRTLASYVSLGTRHLLTGIDHILFIVGLMLFVKGLPALIRTITAFTIAHSLSLAASSLDLVHLSSNPVEAAISLSILFLAYEASSPDKKSTLSARVPWLIAFICGLLHGLGFAGALNEIGLPSGYATEALMLFNLGIEIGQIVLVCLILLLLRLFSGWTVHRPVWLHQVPVYAMGALSSYWLLQRLVATAGWGS